MLCYVILTNLKQTVNFQELQTFHGRLSIFQVGQVGDCPLLSQQQCSKIYEIAKLFNMLKLVLLTTALIVIGLGSAQIHLLLSVVVPLQLIAVLYYLYCRPFYKQSFGKTLLFKQTTWQDNFGYASVKTNYPQVGSRTNSNKRIARIVGHIQEQALINFKEEFYRCKADSVRKLTQRNILLLLGANQLQNYCKRGLQGQTYQQSVKIFGKQANLFEPNIIKMTARYLQQQMGWILACIVALTFASVIYLKTNNLQQFLLHLCLDGTLFLLIFIQSCIKLVEFRGLYGWLGQQAYTVIRGDQKTQVKLSQLLVGDVVSLQQETEIYFKGILVGGTNLTVSEDAGKKQTFKIPLKDLNHLQDDKRRDKCILMPGTKIKRQQKERNLKIIVIQRSLGKYFKLWFQKSSNLQFNSLTQRISKQALWLLLSGIGGLFVVNFVLSLSFSKPIWPIQRFQSKLILICLVFPLLFLANQLVLLVTNLRLKFKGIYAFESELQRLGFCSSLCVEIGELFELRFQELLYRNKLLNMQHSEFIPDTENVKRGSNYDSLRALILYISLGELDRQPTFLKQIFQKYQKHFQYEGPQTNRTITHIQAKMSWTVERIQPKNDMGMRSWLIQYDGRSLYLITQLQQVSRAIFNYLGPKQDRQKKEIYNEALDQLTNTGKQLKAIFFRNLTQDKINKNQQKDYNLIINQDRQRLETRFQFGSYIVFDNQILKQDVNTFDRLRQITNQSGNHSLQVSFVTNASQRVVAGFQHLLELIHPRFSLQMKTQFLRIAMCNKGSIYVGSAMTDYSLHSEVDISVQIRGENQTIFFPCDISIKSASELQIIYEDGRWLLEFFVQNVNLAFTVILFNLLALIYMEKAFNASITHQISQNFVTLITFIVIPSIIRLVASSRPQLIRRSMIVRIITPIFVLFIVFGLLTCIGLVLITEKSSTCLSAHGIQLKGGASQTKCMNLQILIGSWGAVLYFCAFYNKCSWKYAEDWGRMLLLPVWWAFLFLNHSEWQLIVGMNLVLVFILAFKKCVRMRRPAN